MLDKELYSYPCSERNDCIDFLEKGSQMTFNEFCLKYCDSCSDCVVLDVPYELYNFTLTKNNNLKKGDLIMKKELILICEQKNFKNDKNETVNYFDLRVKLNNRTFIVRPLDKDKKFFNYLLSVIMIDEK